MVCPMLSARPRKQFDGIMRFDEVMRLPETISPTALHSLNNQFFLFCAGSASWHFSVTKTGCQVLGISPNKVIATGQQEQCKQTLQL